MKKTAFIVLFFVLAALVGCKDKGYVPAHLLTEQEMIAIMTDVQIIEADINRQISHGEVETLLLCSEPQLSSVSSSVVRELTHFGVDTSPFMPHRQSS